jgi:hypothetical protein
LLDKYPIVDIEYFNYVNEGVEEGKQIKPKDNNNTAGDFDYPMSDLDLEDQIPFDIEETAADWGSC